MVLAVCPGSFDPVTVGHLDIIIRASKTFDKVIVLVAKNADKHSSFTLMERVELLRRVVEDSGLTNVGVDAFDGLLAEYTKMNGANVIVKGLRAVTDFEYEFQMALINKKFNPKADTVFFTTSSEHMYLSSSLVKQIGSYGGDISDLVPPCILEDVKQRICRKDAKK